MNFKLINYGDCNIIKINEEAFLFIRKSGINISVRSDRELNFTKEEYQYYNELFRKQPTLNKVDFPSKLIRFNKDEELWIFNLAETSSYSICIDEHQDIWKYDYKKEGWIKLYEIGAKGHLKSLLKIQKYTTNSVIEEYFGGCKNNQPFINSNINYPLRFKLLRNTKYTNHYKLINNTGECLYLKPDKYAKIMPL